MKNLVLNKPIGTFDAVGRPDWPACCNLAQMILTHKAFHVRSSSNFLKLLRLLRRKAQAASEHHNAINFLALHRPHYAKA